MKPSSYSGKLQPSPPPLDQLLLQPGMFGKIQLGITLHQGERLPSGLLKDTPVPQDARYPELRQTGLTGAEKVPGATDLKISLGNPEPVGCRLHHPQTPHAVIREAVGSYQETVRNVTAPPYPAAQLVKLGKAETLSMLYHHHRSIRHVDTDLDDRGRYQDMNLIGLEGGHDSLFLLRFEPAV